MNDDFVLRLRSIANAYPEDIFGPVTDDERREHASLITRNSAAMGRHLGKFLAQAADEIERLEHEIQGLTGYPPHIAEECEFCKRTNPSLR